MTTLYDAAWEALQACLSGVASVRLAVRRELATHLAAQRPRSCVLKLARALAVG